jgi:diamine N-acetyltransferase
LIERLWEEYHYPEIYLSLFAGNDAAEHLYRSFGFEYIGEKDTGGEDVMRLCIPS